VKRGEIWTVAGGGDVTGKPRPAVILQHDAFDGTDSVTICAFTSDPTDLPLFRVLVQPSPTNGLTAASRLMVDKITTVSRRRLGHRIGVLQRSDLQRLNQSAIVFLGLAGS
jgi:mRNA interferase MazF